jgi:SsrA-binding protein
MTENTNEKTIVTNRKARHDYDIIDRMEAGIALAGSEVKSLRAGKANLGDAYGTVRKGEVWLVDMHISAYEKATAQAPDPLRERKLLLHRSEIKRLARRMQEKGFTLVPLRLYFKNNRVKVELGVARGKRKYDKKAAIAERDAKRDLDREQKQFKCKL